MCQRKDGEMEPLSNRLKRLTDYKQPDEKVIIGEYDIELFSDPDIYIIYFHIETLHFQRNLI